MCVLRANAQCCLIPKWCKVNGTTLTGIADAAVVAAALLLDDLAKHLPHLETR